MARLQRRRSYFDFFDFQRDLGLREVELLLLVRVHQEELLLSDREQIQVRILGQIQVVVMNTAEMGLVWSLHDQRVHLE